MPGSSISSPKFINFSYLPLAPWLQLHAVGADLSRPLSINAFAPCIYLVDFFVRRRVLLQVGRISEVVLRWFWVKQVR
jgi:hypothetical protein